MNLTKRRIYYSVITILFLGLAPLVFFLTSGYRFDFRQGTFVKTGLILIDSSPAKATVALNGKNTGQTTPSRITKLQPGTYTVGLEKDGYRAWSVTIPVYSNQSTIIGKPLLFLKNPVLKALYQGPVQSAWSSSSPELLALAVENPKFLILLNTENDTRDEFQFPSPLLDVEWSPDASQLLVSTQQGFYTLDAESAALPQRLPTIAGVAFSSVGWATNNVLLARNADRLYWIAVSTGTITLSPLTGITAVVPVDDLCWVVTDENTLVLTDQSGASRKSYQLPRGGYTFAEGISQSAVALLHAELPELLLLTDNRLMRVPLTFKPTHVNWNETSTGLTASDGAEIWALNAVNKYVPELLVRISDVGDVRWFGTTHVVYGQANGWFLIDTSPIRGHTQESFWEGSSPPRIIGTYKTGIIFSTDDTPAGLYQLTVM